MPVGLGYDVHKLVPDRPLVLGGVRIPGAMGLLGHSDADVLTHALIDALLGALALGDIGQHFPDSDERYAGICSLDLLRRVHQLVQNKGYQIINVDSTLIAEQPKLAPYILAMRSTLAEVLQIEVEQVSVKATTNEGLGALGRGEGIAALAICQLKKRPCEFSLR
ncbi:MAG: 2-C-methyl-D-erythritol 2,4-cyclodiphosphate synthase [Firmicutes bacterium]|nr:2-C-methyl-D-erythritol 2,4-cyclodiphosphate synthase [Bacillota bacterium]